MGFDPISAVYKAGAAYVRTMPRPMSSATAWLASQIAIEVSPARRLLVERNLQRVYGPDYRGRRLRRSATSCFGPMSNRRFTSMCTTRRIIRKT